VSRALLVAVALTAAACGPTFFMHGGRLDGELVGAPVEDWSFTDDIRRIQVETNPADPYSVNAWCVAQGPRLWVTVGSGEGTPWGRNMLADPRVRVRVGGRLYARRAVRVDDEREIELVRALYQAKYDAWIDLTARKHAIFFRLEPP
jgi:F420H(2)-dependent quinone reductase